jgi:nitrogen fixation/metabolism regulation signal transduction histidine kinase
MAIFFIRRGASVAQIRQSGRVRSGLRWKIVKVFAGTTLFVGLLIIGSLYSVLVDAIQREVNQRALAIATNLSDTAATQVLAKNPRALHQVLAQYADLKEVAYALVEDRQGKLLGDSLRVFPKELAPLLGGADLRVVRRTPATLGGKKLYDTRVPLLNGGTGAVHVGIWQSAINNEMNQALLPIIGLLLVILVVAVLLAIAIAGTISRPILNLAQSADQISRGNLDLPVGIASNDELGELGRSLERLRASLKAAMVRLDHEES